MTSQDNPLERSHDTSRARAVSKPRSPWIAGLLAVACFTAGQVYCGRLRRALCFVAVFGVLYIVIAGLLLYLPQGRVALAISALLFISYWITVIIDAVRMARRGEDRHKWYQRWWFYIAYCAALGIGIGSVLPDAMRNYWCEAFYLPTGSMEHTLLAGDRILVDKWHGRSRPLDHGNVIVIWTQPHFVPNRFPPERQLLVKRIVGIPGNTIEIRDEKLYRNQQPVDEPYANFSAPRPADQYGAELLNTLPLTVPDGKYFSRRR